MEITSGNAPPVDCSEIESDPPYCPVAAWESCLSPFRQDRNACIDQAVADACAAANQKYTEYGYTVTYCQGVQPPSEIPRCLNAAVCSLEDELDEVDEQFEQDCNACNTEYHDDALEACCEPCDQLDFFSDAASAVDDHYLFSAVIRVRWSTGSVINLPTPESLLGGLPFQHVLLRMRR